MATLQTLGEISHYVGRCEDTILKWIREDGFPAVKIGGIWESRTKRIDRWLENQYPDEIWAKEIIFKNNQKLSKKESDSE